MNNNKDLIASCDVSNILSTLLIQYAIVDNLKQVHLASDEQIKFIDAQLVPYKVLRGPTGSGKTSCILLKAILEKLKNKKLTIVIIKPTNLACDILKKKLLDTVEHAIIKIDLTSIEIITPSIYKNSSKKYNLIICDDSWAYSDKFLNNLKIVKNNTHIIVVENINNSSHSLTFTKNFKNQYKDTFFYQTNPYAKSLQIISTLLLTNQANDILVIGNDLDKVKLQDDLEYYIEDQITVLDAKKGLADQNLNNLLLGSYEDIPSINADFVILMDICYADIKKIEYAYNLCKKSVYILYDEESENLTLLRDNFENNKN